MNKNLHPIRKKNEKGIALLFSLGILGLMTVLALTFASVSMTEKSASENSMYGQTARGLAQSAVNRVQAALSMGTEPSMKAAQVNDIAKFNNDYANLVSKDYDSATVFYDWIWKLGFPADSMEKPFFSSWPAVGDPKFPQWQYIKGADDKLIGRFAYITIPIVNKGVFDPSAFPFLNDKNGSLIGASLAASITHSKPRIGRGVYEIKMADVIAADPLAAGTFHLENALKGYSAFNRIHRFDELFHGLSDGATADDYKKLMNSWFSLPSIRNPEAFSMTLPGETDAKMFHRFNLARADWDSLTVNDILGLDASGNFTNDALKLYEKDKNPGADRQQQYKKPSAPTVMETLAASDTLDSVVKCIPWIALWQDPGDFSDVKIRRKQIAANLLDAFNSKDVPTSDSTDWEAAAPTYTGNKKTLYLNEFTLDFKFTLSRVQRGSGTSEDPYEYQYTLTCSSMNYQTELIDVFGGLNKNDYSVIMAPKLHFNQNMTGNILPTPPASPIQLKTTLPNADLVETTDGSTKFVIGAKDGADIELAKTDWISDASLTVEIEQDVADGFLLLKRGTTSVDYANLTARTGYATDQKFSLTCDSDTAASKELAYTFYVKDPRHNLLQNLWIRRYTPHDGAALANMNTIGAKNMTADANTDRDPDAYWEMTSSIWANINPRSAGGIVQSPWELGAIHRAATGQTFNLKAFNTSNSGGNTYAAGDLNLLDQVKMTPESYEYGKLNVYQPSEAITTTNQAAWKALFSGIGLKDAINGTTETSLHGTTAPPDTMIDTIKSASGTTTYDSRAKFLGAHSTTLQNGKAADAAQEEIIGKTAMLLKTVEPQKNENIMLLVIALGQAVKEVKDGRSYTLNKTGFDTGYETYTGQKPAGDPPAGQFSGSKAKTKGIYLPGIDRIMGEQKILAWLTRDMNGKWIIVRLDYVE